MKGRTFLGLLAALVLLASSGQSMAPSVNRDRDQGPSTSGPEGSYPQYGTGSYFNQWPNPSVGDRPSHYPPYHQNSPN